MNQERKIELISKNKERYSKKPIDSTNIKAKEAASQGQLCKTCNKARVGKNKQYCFNCYKTYKQEKTNKTNSTSNNYSGNSNNSNSRSTDSSKADFSKDRVRFLIPNDDSKNPLLWTSTKLMSNNKCLHCAQEKSEGHDCRSKYPFYSHPEIGTQLYHKEAIPKRTQKFFGPPHSP